MDKKTTPVSFKPNLLFCILMDVIGMVSFTIPGIGEFSDVIWAPLSAYIFYKTFGGAKGAIGGMVNFIEEIFPGLDFIPTFTICYFVFKPKEISL